MSSKGFFAALFDFSFASLITPRIIKIVYGIVTVFVGLMAALFLIAGLVTLANGSVGGLFEIILAPILWLLYMVAARISLELVIIVFQIGADVRSLAGTSSSGAPVVGQAPFGPSGVPPGGPVPYGAPGGAFSGPTTTGGAGYPSPPPPPPSGYPPVAPPLG